MSAQREAVPAPRGAAWSGRRLPLSTRECVALAAFVVALLAGSALPYAVAWHATPEDRVYVGTSEASADDYPTYLAKMRSAARGRVRYVSPYAPELESSLAVRPLYAALGAATGALGARLWVGYHVGRLLAGALCLLAIFAVARALARGASERWTAFTLASVGSGIGVWLGREGPRASWSYDLWVPELNAAYAILTNPHFPVAIGLALATFAGVARSLDTRRSGPALLAGVALGALAWIHTYDVLIVAAVLGVYGAGALATRAVAVRDLLRAALSLSATALPAVAWQLAAYLSDPALGQMGRAQPVGSPLAVAAGAGLLLPAALFGAPRLARRSALGAMIAVWALLVPLLLALPLPFARRLVAGWHVPLGLAAGIALAHALARLQAPALRRAALVACVALASLTTLDIVAYQVRRFAAPTPAQTTSLPRDLVDAYAWLDANAAPGDVVLAAYGPSNWLPVFSDLRPYFGHWAEAPDAQTRALASRRFFAPASRDAEREAFLLRAGIDWVLDGPVWQPPGAARVRPERMDRVSRAATRGRVAILRVDQGERTR
ncbi:MAG: hypothetical protein JSU66_01645 [Deltaproteobacteria bacterium]|nr:MAG: hypothetical protein JSU66_01645 [Deltaproteobacteria bacterium]